jgi:hypothetical protein
MKQLTQEQRHWQMLGYSGAIVGFKCRRVKWEIVKSNLAYSGIGFLAGFAVAAYFLVR